MSYDDGDLVASLQGAWRHAEQERDRYRQALEEILEVEPISGTSRLSIVDWANALNRAQLVAMVALTEGTGE